jgi:hypothetical protein
LSSVFYGFFTDEKKDGPMAVCILKPTGNEDLQSDQNQNQDYFGGHDQNTNQLVIYAVSLKQEYQHHKSQCNDTDHNT